MTKAEIVSLCSLHDKKGRMTSGLFVVEGLKSIEDIMRSGLDIAKVYCLEGGKEFFYDLLTPATPNFDIEIISSKDMERISLLKSPPEVVALVKIPRHDINIEEICTKLSLVLDGVQDPGNMGTIIRLADWFGIEDIICSPDSVDCFNPKVVQATMGAIARVRVHYTPLVPFLERVTADRNTVKSHHEKDIAFFGNLADGRMPIYGTFLDGEQIYDCKFDARGLVVMGSEGRGISREVEALITHRLFIPPFPLGMPTSESLNVAVATAIVCSEFRRRS